MLSQPPECCKQAAARSRTQQHAAELLLARLLLPACLLLPPQLLLLLLLPLTDDVVHEADGHGGGVRDSGHARCNGHIHGTLQAKHRLRESRMNVKRQIAAAGQEEQHDARHRRARTAKYMLLSHMV